MDNYSQLTIGSILNEPIAVDKPVYNSEIIEKNKVKTLKIKMHESLVEGTLIDIPFIYYYKQSSPITSIEYIWTTPNGEWNIEVRGSKHGVPDAYAFNVLLAIFKIWLNNNNNILKMYDKKVFDMNKKVHFTYRELAKTMGYKNFGGSIKERIEKGLETIIDTTIYSKQLYKIFTVKNKECISQNVQTMRICSNLRSYSYTELTRGKQVDAKKIKEETSIVLEDFFYYSFCNAHFKIYNYDIYLKLNNDISKKLFLILNKWRNNRNKMVLNFQVLCERIPLSSSKSIYYRRQRIKKAITELVDIGYLSDYKINKNYYEFVFKNKSKKVSQKEKAIINRYNNFFEIKEGMLKYNLTEKEIDRLFDITRIPYIQALLRYCDVNIKNIKNIRRYIIKGLSSEQYKIDKMYYNND